MSRPKPTRPSPAGHGRRPNTQETLDHFLHGLEPEPAAGRPADVDAAHVAGELLRQELTRVGADATVIAARVSVALRGPATTEKPRWNAAARQLWWAERVVRHFRNDAANQAAVLAAFEKAGWPPRIPDPLPKMGVRKAKRRRWRTVEALNNGVLPGTIHFRCDGIGGFQWDVVI